MNTQNPKHLDGDGISFLKQFENCKLKPYLDIGNIPTIGWGNTLYEDGKHVTMMDESITQERADALFLNIVRGFEQAVYQKVQSLLNQCQFNALVSFCYNEGITCLADSNLLKRVNINPSDSAIQFEFAKYDKFTDKLTGIKKKCDGLLERRIKEANMYYGKF